MTQVVLSRRLADLEADIETGIRGYERAGQALREIRDERLYLEAGYSSFDTYCRDRWGFSRIHAYRQIDAAAVAGLLPTGNTAPPVTERQARELAPLIRADPAAVADVWQAAQAAHGPAPTAEQLRPIARAHLARARAAPPPSPAPLPADVRLEVGDATALPWPSESVDLQVTSPPYALGKSYELGDVAPDEWPALMAAWLSEAYRVAKQGGRLAVNVPLDTGDLRTPYADLLALARAAGWQYHGTILWIEGNISRKTAWGSWASPAAPRIITRAEGVGVFGKGEWSRQTDTPPDITGPEFQEWVTKVWDFPGESRPWEGHPAAFPAELPRRLIKLLSFPGDVVGDPFMGSGTTPAVALALGRVAWGVDLSPAYVESARRRLAALAEQAAA